jgi:hypothetical protein
VPGLWQGDIREPILLFVITADFGITRRLIYEMVNELFGGEEAVSQLGKNCFHPVLETLGAVSWVVLTTDEDSWKSIENQIVVIRRVIHHKVWFEGLSNIA